MLKKFLISGLVICCLVWHQLSLAGTWRDDFEDKDTREWKIFNLNRQVEKWWVNDGEAVGDNLPARFYEPLAHG